MKVLVVGHQGMLAQSLAQCLPRAGFTTVTQGRPALDITQAETTFKVIETVQPDIVINAAAYTAVDQAESNKDEAFAVNRDGPQHLADTCQAIAIPLIHVSTDYIFDGTARIPYREDDSPAPLGAYGESKWHGEVAVRVRHPEHLIVRSAWIYSNSGSNFVKTMLRLAREREQLQVVNDQYGCPTSSWELAEALVTMCRSIQRDKTTVPWGTYHFCSAEPTTWYDFAQAIFAEARAFESLRVQEVVPIPTTDYPTPAKRPAYSVLDCAKAQAAFGLVPRLVARQLTHVRYRSFTLPAPRPARRKGGLARPV